MLKKQPKISGIALFCISIKLRPYYFCIISKVFFQQRAYSCLSHLNTNLFFSLHLCPIGNTLTYSVRNYPVVSQSLTGLCNLVGPHNLLNCRGDSSVLLAYLFLLLFGIGKTDNIYKVKQDSLYFFFLNGDSRGIISENAILPFRMCFRDMIFERIRRYITWGKP